jgi:hypothetical protein
VTKNPGVSSILLYSGSGINFPRPLYLKGYSFALNFEKLISAFSAKITWSPFLHDVRYQKLKRVVMLRYVFSRFPAHASLRRTGLHLSVSAKSSFDLPVPVHVVMPLHLN